jgi:hypothetical protein
MCMFCGSLFDLLSFCPFLLDIVLSVLLQIMSSDCSVGITLHIIVTINYPFDTRYIVPPTIISDDPRIVNNDFLCLFPILLNVSTSLHLWS